MRPANPNVTNPKNVSCVSYLERWLLDGVSHLEYASLPEDASLSDGVSHLAYVCLSEDVNKPEGVS